MEQIDQLIRKIQEEQPLWLRIRESLNRIEEAHELGISYRAMARAIGVSESSFRRALRRARRKSRGSPGSGQSAPRKREREDPLPPIPGMKPTRKREDLPFQS